jgi:peptidoglycan hydrolase CwlO-like protein
MSCRSNNGESDKLVAEDVCSILGLQKNNQVREFIKKTITLKKMSTWLFLFVLIFVFGAINKTIAQTDDELKAQLRQQLSQLENQINNYSDQITNLQSSENSLNNTIKILNDQIKRSQLEIQRINLLLKSLNSDIVSHENKIDDLSQKLTVQEKLMAQNLRSINDSDQKSLVVILFANPKLSTFFDEMNSIQKIQKNAQDLLAQYKDLKDKLSDEKDALEEQKTEQAQLLTTQQLQKDFLQDQQAEQKKILTDTKGKESNYQKMLSEAKKNAAAIRSQLYKLEGTGPITFEDAVKYAVQAGKATGVRPALILGILTEETNLGQNVGKGNWQVDLSDPKCAQQREAFVQITSELGLNPDTQPVSKKQWYGYCGGAMGPAQFMPTTWMLYKDSIARITGHNPPSPWNAEDAFTAAALLLKDNGAAKGTYNAEWTAALKYLAGSNWNNSAYRFYGDAVMTFAKKYQDQIDILNS